jgi:hypothetical protein
VTGLPTTQVLLDDGTGTYPYDVTTFTRLPDVVNWSRGRGDEFSSNQTGALSLTFDNTDGRFTVGDPTYNVACDQGVRIKVAGSNRWTGRVQAWPVSWPDGDDTFAVVQATATDALAALARQQLPSASTQAVVTLSPGLIANYPMQEDDNAHKTRDVSGNNNPPLKTTGGTLGAESSFNKPVSSLPNLDGLADGSTGWQLIGHAPTGINQQLLARGGTASMSAFSVTFAYSQFVSLTRTYSLVVINDGSGGHGVTIEYAANTAILRATDTGGTITASALLTDGGPHVITYQTDSTSADLYVDGVRVTHTAATISGTIKNAQLLIGDALISDSGSTDYPQNQVFSRLSYGNARLTDANVTSLHNAILNDYADETLTQRITRLFTYVTGGYSIGTLDSAGDTVLGLAAQDGKSVLDAISDATQADLGQAFVDKNGALSTISGTTTAGASAPGATIDANLFDEGTQVVVDMQNVVNDATGKSTATQNPVTATDAASVTAHGLYHQDYEWNVSTDDQATDRTNWMVASYSEPTPRVGTLTLDLLTAASGVVSAALALDLGSWLSVTGLPSQTPGGTTAGVIVQGITETISLTEWTLTMNVSSHDVVGAWILGDAVFGVLDSTTKLYV